jgi:hypothetical protein
MTSNRSLLTRRRFLYGVGLAAAGAAFMRAFGDADARRYYGLAIVGPARHYGSRLINAVYPPARRIRRHFDYLQFQPGTTERFVADFERTIGIVPVATSGVYMRFLLSTDFFQHGADQTRVVGYHLFYEPSVTLCYNPLSAPPG